MTKSFYDATSVFKCLCGSSVDNSAESKTNSMCLETSRNLALTGEALWLAEGAWLRSGDQVITWHSGSQTVVGVKGSTTAAPQTSA